MLEPGAARPRPHDDAARRHGRRAARQRRARSTCSCSPTRRSRWRRVFASVAPHGYNAVDRPADRRVAGRARSPAFAPSATARRQGSATPSTPRRAIGSLQFDGKTLDSAAAASSGPSSKDDGEFDSITGATVTSRAVVTAVKNTLLYFEQHRDELYARAAAAAAADDERAMTHRLTLARSHGRPVAQQHGARSAARPVPAARRDDVARQRPRARRSRAPPCSSSRTRRCRCMRRVLLPAVRIPLYAADPRRARHVLDLLTHALLYDLHEMLGLFIPLIVVNSRLARACGERREPAARRRSRRLSALATGLGFLFALVALGALREIFGHGTLFAGHRAARRRRQRAARRSSCRSAACSSRSCRPARSSAWRCCSRCATA